MRIYGFAIFISLVMAVSGLIQIILLKYLNRVWWRNRYLKLISLLLPALGIASIILWVAGYQIHSLWLSSVGSGLAMFSFIMILALIISLPFSGIINGIDGYLARRSGKKRTKAKAERMSCERRSFLKYAAAAFPAVTITTGGGGIAQSFRGTKVYLLPLYFKNLPSELNGLRILHLTDAHLGIYKYLEDLEETLASAEPYKPDLVLFTGDICDELSLLPEALNLAASLKTPAGSFAVLGNHEYYRGIDQVLAAFDKSRVVLLRNSGVNINSKGKSFYLAGADDPVIMRADISAFMKQTVEKSLEKAPSDSFKILMTHRPEGFDAAAANGVDLTLAGHTHGGQVGVGHRSFWEGLVPNRYLWGKYEKDGSQMYLSSGIGHWFPFRVGCPPEAPVLELRSA